MPRKCKRGSRSNMYSEEKGNYGIHSPSLHARELCYKRSGEVQEVQVVQWVVQEFCCQSKNAFSSFPLTNTLNIKCTYSAELGLRCIKSRCPESKVYTSLSERRRHSFPKWHADQAFWQDCEQDIKRFSSTTLQETSRGKFMCILHSIINTTILVRACTHSWKWSQDVRFFGVSTWDTCLI